MKRQGYLSDLMEAEEEPAPQTGDEESAALPDDSLLTRISRYCQSTEDYQVILLRKICRNTAERADVADCVETFG